MLIVLVITALMLLLALVLVVRSFGALSGSAGNGSTNRGGIIRHIWDAVWHALHPDFVGFNTDRATAQTLSLLIAAMLVFAVVATVWAAGAGVIRTAWLYTLQADVAKGLKDQWLLTTDISKWQAWVVFAGFLILQVARAVGGVLLISMAAGLAGAMLGFIFGIPRPISAAEAPPAEAGGADPPPRMNRQHAEYEIAVSETRARRADPRLLLEAARVFYAAGADYKTIAEVVAEFGSASQGQGRSNSSRRDHR